MTTTEKQLQVAKLFKEALEGNAEAKHKLAEGIATSDIPVQLSPTLTRVALNSFTEVEKIWTKFAGREVLSDFESSPYYAFVWGDGDIEPAVAGINHIEGGLAHVPEYGEYPVLRFTASEVQISTKKSGVQIKFSWESLYRTRNFQLLKKTFVEFGKRAARTEDIEATRVLVKATGLNTDNFKAANQNVIAGNPELSMDALVAAFDQIATQTHVLGGSGELISPPTSFNLVIPPSLEATAKALLAIKSVTVVESDGGVETRTEKGNPLDGKINEIIVNPYLTKIAGANAAKTWILLPPVGSMPNPAVVNVFLEGEENFKIFVKNDTGSAPEDGAYIDDSYSTKVRHVVSGGFIDPAGTLASNGSGA